MTVLEIFLMRVCIHRGTAEIGGTCIEIEALGTRIVLDAGMPLTAGDTSPASLLPPVPGFRDESPDMPTVLISHPHMDHAGLLRHIRPQVPVMMGAAAKRILDATAFWLGQPADHRPCHTWTSGQAHSLGPFTITPYLVDHSAYDAYALLIEADGKRLFYSGDFRGHGRKQALFERLLAEPPHPLDVLFMEGTVIGRDREPVTFPTETELEQCFFSHLQAAQGITLLWTSAQNIDRLVTVYRAARRAGKTLVLDAFTAEMLRATDNPRIPQGDWPGIRVCFPDWMRRKIKAGKHFEVLERYRANRIYLAALAEQPASYVLLFRPSMLADVQRLLPLAGMQLLYSHWEGYLREASSQALLAWLEEQGIPLHHVHTSGHASLPDLQAFAQALAPRKLVPIHSFQSSRFEEFFANVERKEDGVWWEV
jgi:ribonuclease J